MKKLIFFMALLFWVISCTKRNSSNPNEKVLLQVSQEVAQLDPQLNTGLAAGLQLAKMYESLLETHPFDGPFELLPNLAKSLPEISKDKRTYTFKLRDDVYYFEHDFFGPSKTRKVKAQDFENTFKRLSDPRLASPHYSFWSKSVVGMEEWREYQKSKEKTDYTLPLAGVRAMDDFTLSITIKKPNRFFINDLTNFTTAPIPIEAIVGTDNNLAQTYVGTGPFIPTFVSNQSRLEFIKNKNFRYKTFPATKNPKYQSDVGKQVPFIDRISVKVVGEPQTQWLNLLAHKVHYVEVPKDQFAASITAQSDLSDELKEKGLTLGITDSDSNTYYLGMNMRQLPTNNIHFRKAIAYAIDLNKFNELFFNNTAELAAGLLPPGVPGNTNPLKSPYVEKNLELAKKELALSGVKLNRPLVIIVRDSTLARQVGEFFQKELRDIGLEVKVETLAWPRLLERAQKGEFDFFYLAWFVGLPTGFQFFDLLYGPNFPGSYNRVGYQNKIFDSLYVKAEEEQSPEKQNAIFEKMNKIILDEIPILPLVHARDFFVYWKELKNYRPSEVSGGIEQYFDLEPLK
ncbi:MAG: ABC transporter substrate-binding protein [Bdellovibrio sp.]